MKNTNIVKFFRIIALIAVIGFSLIGCDVLEKEKPFSFDGTWDNSYNVGNQFVFSGNNFIYKHHPSGNNSHTKGTFTYTSTHITFTCTHRENGDGVWYEYKGSLAYSTINDVSKYTLTRKDSADYLDLGNTIGECFSRKRK